MKSSGIQPRVLPALLAIGLLMISCGGPSQRGIEARRAANERFDRVNTQVVYDQARQALATGQFETALAHIDRAIERFPDAAAYHVLRGRILIEQRRMHQAKEALDRAVALNAKNSEAEYFLGVLAQRCGNEEAALRHYRRALELDGRNLQFLAACAELQLAAGDARGARELIERTAPNFDYHPVLQQLRAASLAMEGRADDAAHVMTQASARDPMDAVMAEDLLHACFDAGEWAECLRLLDEPVLSRVRERPDLVRLRARCLMLLSRSIEARDLLLRTMPSGEVPVEHLVALGYAAWMARDWARVAQCGEQLIAGHPRLPEGYLFLGAVERERGNLLASERWLEQASQRGESRELITRMRSRVQAQLASRRNMAEGG